MECRGPGWCSWAGSVGVRGGVVGGSLAVYGEWQMRAPHEMATYIGTITNQLQGGGTSFRPVVVAPALAVPVSGGASGAPRGGG